MTGFGPVIIAYRDALVVEGCTRLPLWHLPYEEAAEMGPAELRAEMRHGASVSGVRTSDLWDAWRARRRADGG